MTQEEVAAQESGLGDYTPGPNSVDISPNSDGGVYKEIIKEGTGQLLPPNGCKVKVHYDGKLLDGTPFDSSRDRGEPFEFNLGKGKVIKAWDVGIATMKKGELAKLICREDYAYGKSGSPPKIPPGATLVFEVEMIDWEPEDLSSKKDKSILRIPIEAGEGYSTPTEGSTVEVHIVGEYDGRVFDERDVTFPLGEGGEESIPPGVERALEKFTWKEKSRLELKPQCAFGSAGSEKFGIPGGATVSYTVTLNKFDNLKDSWALESSEKIEHGKLYREKGTNYFKANKFQLALKMYKRMVTYLEFDSGFEDQLEVERKSLLLVSYLNIAMCYLKLQQYTNAKHECNKALEQDSKNVKALFRRGQAYLGLCEPDLAITDFESVLKIEPDNKAAAAQVVVCQRKIKEIRGKEKQIYANMFEKYTQKKEWRYGWWDKDKPKKEEIQEEDLFERKKKEYEAKKKFLEERAKYVKEMKLRQEQEGNSGEAEGSGDVLSKDEESGDVSSKDEESGDVSSKDEESGEGSSKAGESGEVQSKAEESGEVPSNAEESVEVPSKAGESGEALSKAEESGVVSSKAEESGEVSSKA